MSSAGSFFSSRGRARYAVTDRDGVRATGSRPVRVDPDAARLGESAEPYASFDLARHVGDHDVAVDANRAGLARAIGLVPTDLAFMNQVHGADVAVVTPPDLLGRQVPTADALVTRVPGIALVVMVADCVPVALADEEARIVGVAHAGRKGVRSDVVGATVRAMVEQGAHPDRLSAVIGPAVCAACYEVPQDMQEDVAAHVPAARATSRDGTPALDLRAAVSAQLAAAGVAHVDAVGRCTAEDASLYSYRRDGTTGRFAMVAWLPR